MILQKVVKTIVMTDTIFLLACCAFMGIHRDNIEDNFKINILSAYPRQKQSLFNFAPRGSGKFQPLIVTIPPIGPKSLKIKKNY